MFALVLLGLVLGGLCGAAGVWQWHRFGEKQLANDELRSAAERPAAPVADVLRPGVAVDETVRFRTVTATGTYDRAGQVLVRQRGVASKVGFLVVAPLRTASGTTLFVSRGFVAATGAATQSPVVPDPPAGPVTVTGRVLPSEQGGLGSGLPAGQVAQIDVPALAVRDAAGPVYPAFVELISSTPADTGLVPLPAPDLANPAGGAVTGQHLAYVVQWFLFAAFALAGPVILLLLDRRARRHGPAPTQEREPATTT